MPPLFRYRSVLLVCFSAAAACSVSEGDRGRARGAGASPRDAVRIPLCVVTDSGPVFLAGRVDVPSGDTLAREVDGDKRWAPLSSWRAPLATPGQFTEDRQLRALGRLWSRFGRPRDLRSDSILRFDTIRGGVPIFVLSGGELPWRGAPIMLYLATGDACEFQAYDYRDLDWETRSALPGVTPVPYDTGLAMGGRFRSGSPGTLLITDSATWREFWTRYWVPAGGERDDHALGPRHSPPAIDFGRDAVIAVGFGWTTIGGPYIEAIDRERDTVRVHVGYRERMRFDYQGTDVDVVRIERPRAPVVMQDPDGVRPLDPGDWLAPLPDEARGAYPEAAFTLWSWLPQPELAHLWREAEASDTAAVGRLQREVRAAVGPRRSWEDRGVRFVVDERGRVVDGTIRVSPELDLQAERLLRSRLPSIRFLPALVEGHPVRAWTSLIW